MRPELRNRLIFGFVIGGLVLGATAHDLIRGSHLGMLTAGLLGAVAGSIEFTRLARAHAVHARLAPLVMVVILLVLEAHLSAPRTLAAGPAGEGSALTGMRDGILATGLPLVSLILGFGLLWTVLAQMFRHATENFFANVGSTLFGMIYLGVAFHLLQRLALVEAPGNLDRGTQLVLLYLCATKFGDIAAYFGGRTFGRHKMAPRISPGKTWEGFASSFIGSVGGTYLFVWLLSLMCNDPPFDAWWKPLVWALVLGPLGVAGDLAESAMKRDAAVKDSGSAVPGFGGFLDILDALILAAPVAFVLALAL
jgi:phosphatidate cytidylyltransferase